MKTTTRTILTVLVLMLAAAALLWAGYIFGQRSTAAFNPPGEQDGWPPAARGMMGQFGGNMMGRQPSYGSSRQGRGRNPQGFFAWQNTAAEPLDLAEAQEAVNQYLSQTGLEGLTSGEIMIFENHAYAVIQEEAGGMGAFEVLIDPISKDVFPEPGPNMMWNLKYDLHDHRPGEGPMMGGNLSPVYPEVNPEYAEQTSLSMPISAEEAREYAADYLGETQPDWELSHHLTTFYGYYTIDLEKEGEITGMLSVNGYTGRVFYHHWHGAFVEKSSE